MRNNFFNGILFVSCFGSLLAQDGKPEKDAGELANELVTGEGVADVEIVSVVDDQGQAQLEKIRSIAQQNSQMPPKSATKASVNLDFLQLELEERPAVTELKTEQIRAELERLRVEEDLRQARLRAKLSAERLLSQETSQYAESVRARVSQLSAERKAKQLEKLAALQSDREAALLEKEIVEAQTKTQQMKDALVRMKAKAKYGAIDDELKVLDKQREARLVAGREPVYLAQPLREDGTLVISDRRIPLNGPIMQSTAVFMGERIQFFNNQDREKPIFIVIDNSPGGSVAAGYQILNAMESSEAPIHVVVKSFAASMAAVITTLADESYLLPNARLLHHQMSWGQGGNLSEQRDKMKKSEETWQRLASPVAKKMGVSLEEFIELMYENAADGDWMEYSDKALELKWAKHIAQEIEETALLEHPSRQTSTEQKAIFAQAPLPLTAQKAAFEQQPILSLQEQRDERGEPFVLLPRADPADRFYLYNPDNYYRHHPKDY